MSSKAANVFVSVMLFVLIVIIVFLGLKRFGFFDKEDTQPTVTSTQAPVSDDTSVSNDKKDVSMIFGGDFLLSDEVVNAYNKNGGSLDNIMGTNLQKEFKNADIAMVNNEFPFSTRGEKAPDKQYTFRADPSYVKVLKEMNVDIVSLANNHTLDFGVDALVDTIDTFKGASIEYVGAGNNLDEAKEIKYIEANNKKIAFLGASRVIPVADWNATSEKPGLFTTYDPTKLVEQIKVAESNADVSIVFVHWGIERNEKPEEYQRTLAKQYIDAGADMVIGAHPHVLQGMEVYNGKLITYSLGNFIFNGRTVDTMALQATVAEDNTITAKFVPCTSKSYQTEIADESKFQSIIDYYKGISFEVDIDSEGNVAIQ